MTLVLGLSALYNIRRDIWPEVDFGQVIITTRYLGASPEDVELNVTNKIEDELKAVVGIDRMTSVSMENISVINVFIDPDARNQEEIKNDIEDAVGRITDLPLEVTESPLVTDVETAVFPVIEVGLAGDLPYHELREIAKLFEKKLEAVQGVASVQKFGYLAREIKVEVSPEAISEYQIPLREIITAIRARNIRATAGSFESYTSEQNLVTLAQFQDPVEVGDVIVRSTFDGPLLRVKDLAIVMDGFEDERIVSRINGRQAISFLVNKKESADVLRTVSAIKELSRAESESLPEGVEVLYSMDLAHYVSNRFDVVRSNGLIGLGFVLVMLTFFLNLRCAFWVALGIPVSLLGVVFLMPVFDAYLDVLTLTAMIIVIGIIVDDAIIIAENIQRHREKGAPPLEAAVEGIREVFTPVTTTVLTTFAAFAPMFFMTGLMGKVVFVIPLVITLALLISLVEATIALPAHLTWGLPHIFEGSSKVSPRGWFYHLRDPYQRLVRRFLKFRYGFVVLFTILLLSSLWYAVNFMKITLFPSSVSDVFAILVELPTGSSLRATSDRVKEIEELVSELPEEELVSFVTRIGTQEVFLASGYPPGENENWAFIVVNLTPFSERERNVDQLVEDMRRKTNKLDGFSNIIYSVEGGGPPVGKPITIRAVGPDDSLRPELADSVVALLKTMPGVKDIDRNDKLGKDQVEIRIDYDRLSRLGLTVVDVAQNVRIAYDGEVVTNVRYGDEDVDFRVLLQERARKDPALLAELLIPNRQGRLIPLKDAARFQRGPGPSTYNHYDGDRAITITADVTEGQTTPLEATQSVLNHFRLDRDWPGMRFVVGGEAEETQRSMASLFRAFALAVVGIYFLLILLFNSPTQPITVLAAIPFGIMGVIVAFSIHNEPLSFVAMLGVVGLAGVLVNDSLVLVNHINRLRKQKPDTVIKDIVAEGTADRLRAVLLTSLTTVVGLLPLAYGIGGSDPYIAPMALALAYGLLFATPLTLILVPCLYVIGADIRKLGSMAFRLLGRSKSH
jgi:multidrug efflux pump subunit AcrB